MFFLIDIVILNYEKLAKRFDKLLYSFFEEDLQNWIDFDNQYLLDKSTKIMKITQIENVNRIIEFLSDDAESYTHTIKNLESDFELCVKLNLVNKISPVLPIIKILQGLVSINFPKYILSENSKLNIFFKNKN